MKKKRSDIKYLCNLIDRTNFNLRDVTFRQSAIQSVQDRVQFSPDTMRPMLRNTNLLTESNEYVGLKMFDAKRLWTAAKNKVYHPKYSARSCDHLVRNNCCIIMLDDPNFHQSCHSHRITPKKVVVLTANNVASMQIASNGFKLPIKRSQGS